MQANLTFDGDRAPEFPSLAVASTWFGVFFVLITAVGQVLVGSDHPMWRGPLLVFLWVMLAAFILASLGVLAARAPASLRVAALPLAINLGILTIVLAVPFDGLWRTLNFRLDAADYEAVAALVASGTLAADAGGEVTLPPAYRALAAQGRALVDTADGVTKIYFPLGGGGGLLFRSDDRPVAWDARIGHWTRVTRQQPGWFYCDGRR